MESGDDSFTITTTPPAATTPGEATATTASVPPGPAPQPAPQPTLQEPGTRVAGTEQISAGEASSRLRGYVTSTRYYSVANECVRVEPRGYRNTGYNLEVWHSCPGGGGTSRLLGRWRVDARTGEVFRQRDDGRYTRP